MRRALLLLALLPLPAQADDLLARADIAAATAYAAGGEVTRRVTVDLPAGTSRLLIPMRDVAWAERMTLTSEGDVTLGPPRPVETIKLAEGGLDTPDEAAARARVSGAEAALQAIQDEQAVLDARIAGLESQLAYLRALSQGGPDGAAMPGDPAALAQLLAGLGSETTRVATALQQERIARRAFADRLEAAATDLRGALADLAALRPLDTDMPGIEVMVTSEVAQTVTVDIAYLSPDLSWQPDYALFLDSETGSLGIERRISVTYDGPAAWRDVAMVFSTADPRRRAAPSHVGPAPVRLAEPTPPSPMVRAETADMGMAPVVMPEPVVEMQVSGLSLSYSYQPPVTLQTGQPATLPFDMLRFDMTLENRAVPRSDATAYLLAAGRNMSGEPILPGEAVLYRDGDLVAATWLDLIAAGAEMEFAFGPVDHLALDWQDLSRDTGDRGVFVTSNEERRAIAFSVQNTSSEAETVRLVYATPFSEQEDLTVDVDLSRAADVTDLDGDRGVLAWDLELQPGERQRIEMVVDLSWPEGSDLVWWP